MDELNVEKISQEYFDVLKELGNIGAGNATTALASMLQCRIDMAVGFRGKSARGKRCQHIW